jgi:hypothetical protein
LDAQERRNQQKEPLQEKVERRNSQTKKKGRRANSPRKKDGLRKRLKKLDQTSHREQDTNSQWTGENELLRAEQIIRLDARDRSDDDAAAWMMNVRTFWQRTVR